MLYVVVFSSLVRGQPMESKLFSDAVAALAKILVKKTKPDGECFDQGINFKKEFLKFCKSRAIKLYFTRREAKGAEAERAIIFSKKIKIFITT